MFRLKSVKSQIAMEFIILASLSFFVIFTLILILSNLAASKLDDNSFRELDDFGRSVQQELVVAAEMEVGYHRYLNIPTLINAREYDIYLFEINDFQSALIIEFKGSDLFYMIPRTEGIINKGDITIIKTEDRVVVQ